MAVNKSPGGNVVICDVAVDKSPGGNVEIWSEGVAGEGDGGAALLAGSVNSAQLAGRCSVHCTYVTGAFSSILKKKRNYAPRANQWTLEDDKELLRLYGDGMRWTAMAVIFDRDPDAIRQHHKYIGKNKKPDPVPAAAIRDSLAIDQSRTRNVRGAWTPSEDILLMKAVEAMGT